MTGECSYYLKNINTNEIESDIYSEIGIIDNEYIIYRSNDEKIYSVTDFNGNIIRNDIRELYRYLDKYIITDTKRRYLFSR